MRFLLPWGWAWLTSGLVVVALYLLRRREREEPVSALFLWERIPPDRASRMARLRARFDLLLLLQLLAVTLFAVGLAHPIVRVPAPPGRRRSSSMAQRRWPQRAGPTRHWLRPGG